MSAAGALLMVFAAAAVATPAPAENPAVNAQNPAVNAQPDRGAANAGNESGTTIFGERESPLGLYLTPWTNESPGDVDRPPFLLDQSTAVLDVDDFRQRIQTDELIAAYRRAQMQRLR